MSLERGGKADKYGNEYENRYLANLLLRVANEKLASVMVEPIDELSNSFEYTAEGIDGSKQYYQCKSSNGQLASWTVSSLQKHDVLNRIKKILSRETNAQYYFITSIPCNEMYEICKRARSCNNPAYFKDSVTTNEKMRTWYNEIERIFGTNEETLIFYLSRCYFELYPFTEQEIILFEDNIDSHFTGDPRSARILLEHYVNGTEQYGVKITTKDVIDYLANDKHYLRVNIHDDHILQKIEDINNNYWKDSPRVNNKWLHRAITDEAIQKLQDGCSLVIHGKAGAGKSGCLQEIRDYLSKNNILFLSIKLDMHVPVGSADEYGKSLGLLQSPVFSLLNLAAGKECVLILDQLDSIRWTNAHSNIAFAVCKELISQAKTARKNLNSKLSIVFATRTYDMEYDPSLKQLFDDDSEIFRWEKIQVDYFSDSEVAELIGDDYNSFSSRLKKLLRMPSSLYIWSRLTDNHKSFSSANDLIGYWWEEILSNCEKAGIDRNNTEKCKNTIVSYMKNRSTLTLSKHLFESEKNIIDKLVSCGILQAQNDIFSFVHQSIFDYFICQNILAQLFSTQNNLPDIIEAYDNQTPHVRYQIQSVLQLLIDIDMQMFINQSILILESSSIHDYIKCCVFEIIGQYEEPNKKLFSFIDKYYQTTKWKEYIYQIVFYGHPIFVKHYATQTNNWLEDKPRVLLNSIADKDSLFVSQVLCQYITSEENAKTVYNTLPHNISNEAKQSFALRLEILNQYPELLDEYFSVYDLINQRSQRALDLIAIIIKKYATTKFNRIHIGMDKEVDKYIKTHCKAITKKIFPLICEATKNYHPCWPNNYICKEYEDWIKSFHRESVIREIVEMVKDALCELANSSSEDFCNLLNSIKEPLSGIGHEMIMASFLYLPETYSDLCINWLLTDFDQRVFVFSSDISDFLAITKSIIKKHTRHCSIENFRRLEHIIYYWKDNKEEIKHMIRKKHELQAQGYYMDNYPYWGFMQKTLLPCMDYNRLSDKSKDLLSVLTRNKAILTPHYFFISSTGPAKYVVSPIEEKTDKLTDNNWLEIIAKPIEKMTGHMRGKETDLNYIESSHMSFSTAMGNQAKREPLRFVNLAFQFPDNCYPGYISHIFYAIKPNKDAEEVPKDIICELIRKYMYRQSTEITFAILRTIEDRAEYNWPNDILKFVVDMALSHPDPDSSNSPWSNKDIKYVSEESLSNWSFNCVRGSAIQTIGKLLWYHREKESFFRKSIQKASKDNNPAVRLSVLSCVLPYYNYDNAFAEKIYRILISQDSRILASRGSLQLLVLLIKSNQSWYWKKIDEAINSRIEDLPEEIAGLYCQIAIVKHNYNRIKKLLDYHLSTKQHEEICKRAIWLMSDIEYHDVCKQIIQKVIENSKDPISGLSLLFYENRISMEKDSDFLISIIDSLQGEQIMHSFLRFINESDSDICLYGVLLQRISKKISMNPKRWEHGYWIDDYIECVLQLYDKGCDRPDIRSICLDILDKLYISNPQGRKSLSDILDDNYDRVKN